MIKPNPERIWKFIKIPKDPNGCWIWIGCFHWNGYGQLTFDHEHYRSHRFVYEYLVDQIPKGIELHHVCENRRCVNPFHLQPLTPKEHMMKGMGIGRINIEKTHCNHGHKFTKENIINYNGWRYCRKCKDRIDREYRNKKRQILIELDEYNPPNKEKTHCIKGHEFTEKNTYYDSAGFRQCKECKKIRQINYRARKKLLVVTN